MTQIPAGWYPDPDPSSPQPRGQRYWDGRQWTEHVTPAAPAPGTGYAPMAPYSAANTARAATTPDGQALAGWWQRVGAYLIDLLILTPLVVIAGFPWLREIVSAYADLVDESITAAENGTALPDQADLLAELFVPFLLFTLVALAVNFVYNVGFLKWKAATPGKLVVGLRVRLRELPGPLSWGTVLLRWAGQNWYAALSWVPVLGNVLGLYPLLDVLWPLWDDKKQALHDKVAKTNVVRVR
ncbi:MAG: RDD family protein [Nocardioides sp.]